MKPTTIPPPGDHSTSTPATPDNNGAEPILAYLKDKMPEYPFDPDLDVDFVDELIDDFDQLDILHETKAFRWYYDNQPAQRLRNLRLGLRRWLTKARQLRHRD